jgi:hypothetical protein
MQVGVCLFSGPLSALGLGATLDAVDWRVVFVGVGDGLPSHAYIYPETELLRGNVVMKVDNGRYCTYLPIWLSLDEQSTRVATMIPATAIDRICVRQRSCQLLVVKGSRIERHRPDGGVNISRANIITIGVSVLGYSNVGIRVFHSWYSSIPQLVFKYPNIRPSPRC